MGIWPSVFLVFHHQQIGLVFGFKTLIIIKIKFKIQIYTISFFLFYHIISIGLQ